MWSWTGAIRHNTHRAHAALSRTFAGHDFSAQEVSGTLLGQPMAVVCSRTVVVLQAR